MISGNLDGGGGSNTLDYSPFIGNVIVDLLLKSATDLGPVNNVTNVTGSAGSDVIVGGTAKSVLRGGTGRNVLIAEAGASQLIGGGGDDILIAGTTTFDSNLTALGLILAEWTQNTSPTQRMNHINGSQPGGANGPYFLTTSTVHWNNQVNNLTDGLGTDWLFLHQGVDQHPNPKPSDIITPI
jgi:Ca2+-binding RTX toxin-like protein